MSLVVPLTVFIVIFTILIALAVYDCKHYILPNELNAALGVAFIIFHTAVGWSVISPVQAGLGAVVGGGFLLLIRALANRYYAEDALGLGDVKLITAAGLGLGFPDILLALSCGAGFGLLHGLLMGVVRKRRGEAVDFGKINVPAGLGLCAGIALLMVVRLGVPVAFPS